jgi:hypothetical protein
MVAQFGPRNRSSRSIKTETRPSIVAAIPAQTHSMPIRPSLDGLKFDPETIRVMGWASHSKWPWWRFDLLTAATLPTKCSRSLEARRCPKCCKGDSWSCPLPKAHCRVREYLTEREVERLIKAVCHNRHGHRDATMILLAFRRGLRAYARLHVSRAKNGMASVHPLTGVELRALPAPPCGNPNLVTPGVISRASSNCLPRRPSKVSMMPVTLPPGRLRLATSPSPIGSIKNGQTIGVVGIACFAASAAADTAATTTSGASVPASAFPHRGAMGVLSTTRATDRASRPTAIGMPGRCGTLSAMQLGVDKPRSSPP